MEYHVTVQRGQHGTIKDVEYATPPEHWTDFDVRQFLAKLEWFIQSIGPAVPQEVIHGEIVTTFRVTTLGGDVSVRASVQGVPEKAVRDWEKQRIRDTKNP